MIVIDADGAVLGRMATRVAKSLLNGEKVVIVNAEKAVISGSKKDIYARYKQRRDRADRANPRMGPKFPRTPDRIVRRTVRGMVNYKTQRGARAYKNLRTFLGVPEEYAEKAVKSEAAAPRKRMTVLELSRMLGWKGGE
ncbi:MAG: 50S ribosomal protein L13 [Candidatus Diapherotrites archaeon]|nr:50S ribosomal protein L13 [Candidatus Diapherotrites archaeon]